MSLFGDRIYLNYANDRRSHPYLVISQISDRPNTTLCGEDGLDRGLYDFDFYCKSNQQRETIFIALRAWAKGANTTEMNVLYRGRHTGFGELTEASRGIAEFSIWLRN